MGGRTMAPMSSGLRLRLVIFSILAIAAAAAAVVLRNLAEPHSSPAAASTGARNAAGESSRVVPATGVPASAAPHASASEDRAARRAPAASSGGDQPDPAKMFAEAIAAAGRNGSSANLAEAQARTGQQALDLLDRLAQEQARKDAVPLTSPFGGDAQQDRRR